MMVLFHRTILSMIQVGFNLPDYRRRFHDWQRQGHGWVDLHRAIITSCDVYFYHLAYLMAIDRINAALHDFGFGSPTNIDLGDESAGTVASPDWKKKVIGTHWYNGDTILSGIGQGFMQTTPLQLAVATATLANHGQGFTPLSSLERRNTRTTHADTSSDTTSSDTYCQLEYHHSSHAKCRDEQRRNSPPTIFFSS